ncbi:MAG: SusC/RagA family TonB-linked outer membrane protein [Ferruginibacter sp.]
MRYLICCLLLQAVAFTLCGQQLLTGRIFSEETGLPLQGVRINTAAAGNSSTSNAEGIFKISCSVPDTLLLEKPGFALLRLPVDEATFKTTLRLTLLPLGTHLEEVVVNNGYQPLPRERATGAYSYINAETLSQRVSTDVLSRLEGMVSGISFDRTKAQGRTTIMIRGLSTIQGPKEPLIVIDNFVYSGDIANINPNDVESITVLKDAAATSVWGARAGNGVIVITTKKGRYNKKLSVSLSSNMSFTAAPDLFYLPSMKSADVIEVEKMLFANGFNFADTAADERPVFSPVYELLFRRRNGSLNDAQLNAALDSLSQTDVRKEFDKYLYRTAMNTQHNIAVQGGSNTMAWRFSAGLDENVTNLAGKYRRINISTAADYKPAAGLQINTSLFYTNSYTTGGRPGYSDIITARGELPLYTSFADANGTPLPVMNTYRQPYTDTAGGGKLLNWNYYPLTDYQHNSSKTYLQNITGSIGLQYRFLKNYNISIRYQYENQLVQNKMLYGEQSYMSRNLVNLFTQINHQTGELTYGVPKGAILDDGLNTIVAHNLRAQLGYNANFAQHAVAAIAGWEIRDARTKNTQYRTYGYNDDIAGFSNTDYLHTYPTYISGAESFIPGNQYFDRLVNRFVSAFANAGYSYKNRYHFTTSLRRDASNLFGANTNDKWNLLWSAGVGWDISKENFYRIAWLPYLKWRTTWGKSGNADPSVAAVATISYFIQSSYTGTMTAILDKFKNPDLGWEQMSTLNTGFDFKLPAERISGSVDLYWKRGKNLYGTTPVDYTAVPTTRIIKNVAAMKGSGMDAEINSININRRIQWTSQLQLSTNTDKVTRYYLSTRQAGNFLSGGNNISAIEGRPVYAVYSYKWAGLDAANGNPLGYFNGTISSNYAGITGATTTVDSLTYHGRALPAVFGALGNTLRYKNFYFTARLSYKFGYYIRKATISYNALFNRNITHSDYYLRWQQPGDELHTTVPSMPYPSDSRRDAFYANSPVNVVKGDHIRLQFITLGYEFNESTFKRLPFKTLNLFCSISNIGILWRANKDHIDPDYLSDVIPPSLSCAAGIHIQFK